MNSYETIADAIVKHQESIVGPLAWSEAEKVTGLSVKNNEISISGEGIKVIESLVKQYENLFGQASIEVCKDAVKPILPQLDKKNIPSILL